MAVASLDLKVPINPFAPENFAKKSVLKLVDPFSGHCLATGLAIKS